MIEITRKEDCCGCWACVQRCPRQCISMSEDEEGFLYPRVDLDACIHCGLCEKVCPVINRDEPRHPQETLAAVNTDRQVQMSSSSGGVFTALAEVVIARGGVVFGARFNDRWGVEHDCTETIEGLASFRGSKYVQSLTGDCYARAETFLKQGREVLYSGTSCQIAGLRRFLRKNYTNLLTVDVVCHGVPSPLVWREYLRYVLRPKGAAAKNTVCQPAPKPRQIPVITGIAFRDKRISWEKYGLSVRSVATEGSDKNSVCQSAIDKDRDHFAPLDRDLYMQIFLKNLDLRPSCHECPAKAGRSGADLTIADFWGIGSFAPEFYDRNGVSLMLVNTPNGSQILKELNLKTQPMPYESGLCGNRSIEESVAVPTTRAAFWKAFHADGITAARPILRSMRPPLHRRIILRIKIILYPIYKRLMQK